MKKTLLIFLLAFLTGSQVFAQCSTNISGTLNSCPTNCNGSVTFTSTAGTPPYNLVVTGGPTTQYTSSYTWTGVCPGSYHYDITDATMSCNDSGTVVVTAITPTTTPALTIEAFDILGNSLGNNPTVCELQTIDFNIQAPFVNIVPNTYTWKKNGVPVLVQNNVSNYFIASYSTPALASGDIITLEVSWPNACMSSNPQVSQGVTFTVTPNQPPSVSISHNFPTDTICHGNIVTFTAAAFNAGTPTYQWFMDGAPVSTASTYSTLITLANGAHQVWCQITSSDYCDTQEPVFNPTVTSNTISFSIDPCFYHVPASGSLGPYTTCSSPFYDSQNDTPVNYSNNVNGLVKLCPAVVGLYVTISFTSLNLNDAGDRLRIFPSSFASTLTTDTSNGPLFNVAGPVSGPNSAIVTSNVAGDGCLTAHFRTDAAGNAAGWVANIICLSLPSVQGSIQGDVYLDANANCVKDSGETAASNIPLRLLVNNTIVASTVTNTNGHYLFNAVDSVYTVTLVPGITNYGYYPSCPSTGQVSIPSVPSLGNDFAVQCSQGFDLIAGIYNSDFRPGFTSHIYPSIQNFHCQPVSGEAKLILPPDISFSYATGLPHTASGDTIIWNFSNLHHSGLTLGHVGVVTSMSASIGDSVFLKFMVEPTAGDSFPANNIVIGSGIVTNSYDPNDKAVSPEGPVLPGSWLTYTIRFQNTGTDTAFNVSIIDTLDSNLDLYSFQPLAASHAYDLVMLDSNVVKFVFNNIMLPDSNINESLSHGYITYRVKSLPWLANGASINNTAHIYFDINPAVVTNTTLTLIDNTVSIPEQNISISTIIIQPNPASGELRIKNAELKIENIEIYNVLGKKIFNRQPEANSQKLITIDVSSLPSGLYFVKVKGEKTERVGKFVKE